MREIKFRAWDKDRMVKGFELFEDNSAYRGAIPMQFTGLKDKNGKEIYEGDICKVIANDDKYLNDRIDSVAFEKGTYVLPNIDLGGYELWRLTDSEYNRGHKTCEVIGNIYENPELLKAVEKGNK